jgi:hypothetical protein
VPALAILAGLGGQWLWDGVCRWLRRRRRAGPGWAALYRRQQWLALVAALLCLAPLGTWLVRHHPHQIAYFNPLIGGLAGARARGVPDATDYWANSYRVGLDWLNAHAAPNAVVLVGVAEHTLYAVREVRLRRDLQPRAMTGVPLHVIESNIARGPRTFYLMYVIRPGWYLPLVQQVDGKLTPVHEIAVDGAPILRILKLN